MSTGGPRRGLEGERPNNQHEKNQGHPKRAPLWQRSGQVVLNTKPKRGMDDPKGITWRNVPEDCSEKKVNPKEQEAPPAQEARSAWERGDMAGGAERGPELGQ